MGVYVVTGAASGIGQATTKRLRVSGHHVIGVDLRSADIEADLGTPAGREAMIRVVTEQAADGLDGVLAAAGISSHDRPAETIAINYFGAIATLEGLRPLLAKRPASRAVAIGSTSVLLPTDAATLAACLGHDEPGAVAAVRQAPMLAYMTSKLAFTHWMRTTAVSSEWAGAGILLNGVAPGVVKTPMTAPLLTDPAMLDLIAQSNPMAVEEFATPDEIAELIAFLLTFEGHYLLGQMIFIDGGTEAIMRPDAF